MNQESPTLANSFRIAMELLVDLEGGHVVSLQTWKMVGGVEEGIVQTFIQIKIIQESFNQCFESPRLLLGSLGTTGDHMIQKIGELIK